MSYYSNSLCTPAGACLPVYTGTRMPNVVLVWTGIKSYTEPVWIEIIFSLTMPSSNKKRSSMDIACIESAHLYWETGCWGLWGQEMLLEEMAFQEVLEVREGSSWSHYIWHQGITDENSGACDCLVSGWPRQKTSFGWTQFAKRSKWLSWSRWAETQRPLWRQT